MAHSGGAPITVDGKLVGINPAIIAPNGCGNVGIGFAEPIDMALGVEAETGAIVSSVEPDTPPDDAGLAADAVILAVNGGSVEDSADLRRKTGLRRPGDEV